MPCGRSAASCCSPTTPSTSSEPNCSPRSPIVMSAGKVADGTATGTIFKTDPIPKAWIARFGRTVAEQVIDTVEARIRAPRSPGVEFSLAGQRVGGSVSPDRTVQTDDVAQAGTGRNLAEWFGNGNDPEGRHGLEGSRPFRFEGGASLTPRVEIGARHDGGDAETRFGVDIGGGLAWSDPQRGLSVEIRGRGFLSHAADGFRERGFSGSLSWDPTPGTTRGLSFSMSQTLGAQAAGGVDGLLERGTFAELAANDNADEFERRRLEFKLGYGFRSFGGLFTSIPEAGFGMSEGLRDYSLDWRLVRDRRRGDIGSLEFALEARRQESANVNTPPERFIQRRPDDEVANVA